MPKDKEKDIEEDKLIAYLHGESSDKERLEIEAWLAESPEHKELYKKTCNAYYAIRWTLQEKTVHTATARKRLQSIWQKRRLQHKNYAIAAISILLLSIGGVLLWKKTPSPSTSEIQVATINKEQPKVMLVLADGSSVALDKPQEILIAAQDSLTAIVDSCGQIHYNNIPQTHSSNELSYNTLIIPRGGEYFIKLSDGTKVWLGADSRFEYPIAFGREKRIVKLKGEAYFEVAKDSQHPFIVHSDKFKMQVYGTEFNLNTYDETQIQLALVSGSIGFKANTSVEETFLLPGQLGEANILTGQSYIQNVNIEKYTSWKNGYVIFENECLESIMEKLSRWYNVEVFFENEDLKKTSFYGNLKRYENIEEFLSCLQKVSNVYFYIKDGIVIVKRK